MPISDIDDGSIAHTGRQYCTFVEKREIRINAAIASIRPYQGVISGTLA